MDMDAQRNAWNSHQRPATRRDGAPCTAQAERKEPAERVERVPQFVARYVALGSSYPGGPIRPGVPEGGGPKGLV